MNFTVAVAGETPAVVTATAAAAALEHRKLTVAAQQFEGMLLQELLKPMKEHGFCEGDGGDGDDNDGGRGFADTLSSYGTEAMATAIAKSGGMGIAKRVVTQVEGERTARTTNADGTVHSESQNKTAPVLKFPRAAPMS